MWNFIKKLLGLGEKQEEMIYNGARLDVPEVMAQAIHQEELVAKSAKVEWKPLDLNKLPDWPTRDQDGSSGCVAFSMAEIVMMMLYAVTGVLHIISAVWFYFQRSNKPEEGMTAGNSADIWENTGALLEEFMPSDGKSEAELNNPKMMSWFSDLAKAFVLGNKQVILPTKDFDSIVSTLEATGKPINVWYQFASGEWAKTPTYNGGPVKYCHSVVVPSRRKPDDMVYGIYNGKRSIVVKESWGKIADTINGYRIITEDFHTRRNYFARYFRRFKFEPEVGLKPIYDGTVKSLQDCLRFEGTFPANTDSTGVFGPVTTSAVQKFQIKYGIEPLGIVGPKTKAKLLELFN